MNTRTLNDCLTDYYSSRRGRYSPSTWKAHELFLERFRDWISKDLGHVVYLTDIDDRTMTRYYNRLRPPHYSPNSFNNYRQMGNQFFTFCRGEGWCDTNPMRHVDPLRPLKRVRLQLSADELLRMLEQCPTSGAGPRDRVALALGMNTGLRGGDIADLKIGSVNLGNDTLLAWVEKTDQETELPITAELHVELLRWFQSYAAACGLGSVDALPLSWTLVPPAAGRAVNPNDPSLGFRTVYNVNRRYRHPETIVQRALERMGHPTKQEGFHTLRRSAARELYETAIRRGVGDPIRIAQALLGHKSVKTTEVYLGITHEKRQRDELMRGQSFLGDAVRARAEQRQQVDGVGEVRRLA